MLTHILSDLSVKICFRIRQLIGYGVGNPLGKQRRGVELQQILFHHPPHQVGHIGGVHAVAKAPFKTIPIEQGHEELEIFFLAIVGGGGHQQKVAGQGREQLSQLVALGVFDLPTEEGGRKLVGFVAND